MPEKKTPQKQVLVGKEWKACTSKFSAAPYQPKNPWLLFIFSVVSKVSLRNSQRYIETGCPNVLGHVGPRFLTITAGKQLATWVCHDLPHLVQVCRCSNSPATNQPPEVLSILHSAVNTSRCWWWTRPSIDQPKKAKPVVLLGAVLHQPLQCQNHSWRPRQTWYRQLFGRRETSHSWALLFESLGSSGSIKHWSSGPHSWFKFPKAWNEFDADQIIAKNGSDFGVLLVQAWWKSSLILSSRSKWHGSSTPLASLQAPNPTWTMST